MIYGTETDSDIENRLVVATGEGEGLIGTLGLAEATLYIRWKKKKKTNVLLYSTENYLQYPMINHNGKEY